MTKQWAAANPRTLAAFTRAFEQGQDDMTATLLRSGALDGALERESRGA